MKTKRAVLLVIAGLAVILTPLNINAAVYSELDVEYMTSGKVNVPVFPDSPYTHKTYYPSGNLFKEVDIPSSTYYYLDEIFYSDMNKGRIYRIDICTTYAHTDYYTFEYYGNTDCVRKAVYYECYGTIQTVYSFSTNGVITSIDRLAYNTYPIEHREYDYKYDKRTGKIKHAERIIITYNPHYEGGNMNRYEENNKDFYRNGNLRREKNVIKSYVDVDGKPVLQSMTKTVDRYSKDGVIERRVCKYIEYDPLTGRIVYREITVTEYDKKGRPKTKSPQKQAKGMNQPSKDEVINKINELKGQNYTFTGNIAVPKKTSRMLVK